jgi:hypothetical protein
MPQLAMPASVPSITSGPPASPWQASWPSPPAQNIASGS